MFDEISKDDMNELEKKFKQLMETGKMGSVENLSHLPLEEKERISKELLKEVMEKLMRKYLSLGLLGEAILGAEDGFTGNKYKLIFKAMRKDDKDEHFDGR